ncbi:NYN domain-containing protein [Oleidesulfovibrio sp.]|uniref:NYN domain-containing protein n=1 Tax=Oleidesulfovibrio sp. TaxID=2909707 RepID=UPI003A8449D4
MRTSGSIKEVYSALFVDFDNIYTRLAEQDPQYAYLFATDPQRWLRWLEFHALRMLHGDGVRRRILKRCCYLNPQIFQEFRPHFVRTAFSVTDCPPLTKQGKTSADIHLVIDALDALSHPTYFDEFIILSGDADFTPLLIRLREHARKTLILSVGFTSPAYAAASAWRIREDMFIGEALRDQEVEQPVAKVVKPAEDDIDEMARRGAQLVREYMQKQPKPVPLAVLAYMVRKELGLDQDWMGEGKFMPFLERMNLTEFTHSQQVPGYLYDPIRHEPPREDENIVAFRNKYPEMFEFAQRVHRKTDHPVLMPEHFIGLLHCIADELEENEFSLTQTSRNVRDRCSSKGLPVARSHVNWLLVGIARGGYKYGQLHRENVKEMAKAAIKNAHDMLMLGNWHLTREEEYMLMSWLYPKCAGQQEEGSSGDCCIDEDAER